MCLKTTSDKTRISWAIKRS